MALADADLVLVLGTPLDFRLGYGRAPTFAADAKVVMVDVDGAELGRNRPLALGLTGDVGVVLRQAVDVVAASMASRVAPWLRAVRDKETESREKLAAFCAAADVPIAHYRLAGEIARVAGPETIVVGDGGDVVGCASKVVALDRPGQWLDPGPLGCLGVGPPSALTAKLLHPERPGDPHRGRRRAIRPPTGTLGRCRWRSRRGGRRARGPRRRAGAGTLPTHVLKSRKMPIYEYECHACRRRVSLLVRSISSPEPPACPRCGSTALTRVMSRFTTVKSEEARLESLAEGGGLGDLDENDPASVARFMKKMGREFGDELGDDFDSAVDEAMSEAGGGDDDGAGDAADESLGSGSPSEDL